MATYLINKNKKPTKLDKYNKYIMNCMKKHKDALPIEKYRPR